MRVLLTITYYDPYISGLTICAERIAEGLAGRGADVTVLTTQHDKKLKMEEFINNIKVIRVPFLLRLSKGFIIPFYLIEVFKSVLNSDVVIVNMPQVEAVFVAIIAKFLAKPVVTIYHCEVELPKGFINSIIQAAFPAVSFIVLSLSTKIVSYTKDYSNNSQIAKRFGHKLVYIYPPVSEGNSDLSFQRHLSNKISKSKKYRIGIAARVAAEKGFEYVFRAIPDLIRSLGSFEILIAGPREPVGEEGYSKKIKPLIARYKNYITFLDSIPLGKMKTFYSLLDVLVLPSINKTEAFGLVQVEAMLSGVPVVASNLPGVRIPIQKTGMGIVVEKENPKALVDAISEILLHKKKYIKPKKIIEEIFNESESIDKYYALLKEMVI